MGYCLITGGGEDGRYDIELDFGKAQKDSILAALTTAINKNELDILQTENLIAQAEVKEQALALVLVQLQDIIATGAPAAKAAALGQYPKKTAELAQLKAQNEPLRYTLRQLKFVRASLRKQAQQFNLFQPIQRKQAWCTDLTEDRAAGAYVGTLEVEGEPDLVLIQPGARAWIPTDGIVRGREIMSPWQAYYNAAVMPGWQKWKPTYRWGTISSINYSNDTCSVSLTAATSSAQRLDVNQASTLSNVPITYMTCNAEAFKESDRVIVRFSGQDWEAPMVIGFVDNPKACEGWKASQGVMIQNGVSGIERYLIIQFDYKGGDTKYYSTIDSAALIECKYRNNRGAWVNPYSGPTLTSDLVSYSGIWTTNALEIVLKEPGYGGFPTYSPAPGYPAHLRIAMFVNSGWAGPLDPDFPLDSTLEVLIRLDGEVFADVALRLGFSPPYSVDCDRRIVTGGAFEQLDYVRFVEDGT